MICMIENNINLNEIANKLKEKNRIIIISHVRPDGDTLACAFALKSVLINMGKKVICTSNDKVSSRLSFLCDSDCFLPDEIPTDYNPDLIVSVDVASVSMLGNCEKLLYLAESIKIDHHFSNDAFADYNYADPDSASCSEIIFDLVNIMGEMSDKVCELLYAGISFDTGCFKHSNVTEGTHQKAAYLVSRGVNTAEINQKLFGNKTKKEISALQTAYNSLEFYADGKIAIVCITNDMKSKKNLDDDDLSDISQIPVEIEGVLLGITLKEKSDVPCNFKASMRSVPGTDASAVCQKFGGGGHICAAGCLIVAENKDILVQKVLEAALPEIK